MLQEIMNEVARVYNEEHFGVSEIRWEREIDSSVDTENIDEPWHGWVDIEDGVIIPEVFEAPSVFYHVTIAIKPTTGWVVDYFNSEAVEAAAAFNKLFIDWSLNSPILKRDYSSNEGFTLEHGDYTVESPLFRITLMIEG